MTNKLHIAATALAVSLNDARSALKVDGSDLDSLITLRIREITEYAEHIIGRSIMRQTWREYLPAFEGPIQLFNPPLIGVSSVKYIDQMGTEQTVPNTDYWVDNADFGAFVIPKSAWPSARLQPNSVTVEYICGYGDSQSEVPAGIQGFILAKLIEQFDGDTKNVQTSVQASYLDSLLDRYKVYA